MKLYFTKGACSLACRIVINEIGLSCEYISVDLKAKRTKNNENFYDINPKGAVPVLVTDDNQILTENSVIQQYLADVNQAYNLLPKVGDIKRYRVLEWLNYNATELHKGFSVFFNPQIPQEIKNEVFTPVIEHKFKYLDKSLGDKSFLVDEEFTLPDAYLFVMLIWAIHFKFQLNSWPNIERYYNDVKNRKSIKQSLEEERITI